MATEHTALIGKDSEKHRSAARNDETDEGKNRGQKKSDPKVAFFELSRRSVVLDGKFGAADGTRTRDPRRDRPVF